MSVDLNFSDVFIKFWTISFFSHILFIIIILFYRLNKIHLSKKCLFCLKLMIELFVFRILRQLIDTYLILIQKVVLVRLACRFVCVQIYY